jgi:hypothetical protein
LGGRRRAAINGSVFDGPAIFAYGHRYEESIVVTVAKTRTGTLAKDEIGCDANNERQQLLNSIHVFEMPSFCPYFFIY